MAFPKNFDDWQFTKKVIRIGHNREVKKYFKDVKPDNARANGRQALKTALLIRNDDSAIEILNKQFYFRFGLAQTNIDTILSVPESWFLKPGYSIPQLAIIYRPDRVKNVGNYSIVVPNYNGSRKPVAPKYTKGNFSVRWILKDGSKLTVNAVSETEGRRVITELKKYVNKQMWTDDIRTTEYNRSIIQRDYIPLRADFYPNGRANSEPLWRHYFN